MKVEHLGQEHLLHLESREVALLVDILEAAVASESISGTGVSDPSLSQFFNSIYSDLIDTAREIWQCSL